MPHSTRSFVALCLLGIAELSAQQPSSTATLSGLVVTTDATAPQPVRRAIVTLGGDVASGQSAITDDQGRFTFNGLPSGRFTLTASKPAHITTAYGAKGAGRPGTTITLGAGQSIDNLTLTLPHGASVNGVVRDRSGEPASTVQVVVLRVDGPRPATDPMVAPDCLTDDRGVFRSYGLAPGTYIVAALPRVLGSSGGMSVMSSDDVDAAFKEQQLRAGRSPTGASGAAAAPAAAAVASAPQSPPIYGYVPIYYPATPVSTDATRVTLRAGEDLDGIDITINLVPLSAIEGRVLNSSGPLPELTLTISADGPSIPGVFGTTSPSLTGPGGGRPGVNGNDGFKFINVAPGHYTIFAQTSYTRTTVTGGGFSTTRLDPGTVPMVWASTDLDVSGNDISGVTLQLQPAMTFAGRVAFDAASLAPPQNLASIRVTLSSATSGSAGIPTLLNGVPSGPPRSPSASAAARADGTFEVPGVLPGHYTIGAVVPGANGPSGWWLRSAVAGGRDLLDAPLEIGPGGSIAEAVLTFTDRHTEITGSLLAGAGRPAPEYFVIILPADPALQRAGSRRVKTTRPSNDGRFSFADLPAGEYILAALVDVVGDEWQAPAFLGQVARSGAGVRVALGEGEKKTQNLQISGR